MVPIYGANTCRSRVRIPADSAVLAIRGNWQTISASATLDSVYISLKNGADLWRQYLPIEGPNSRRFYRIGDSGELANHFGECNVGLGVHFVKKPAPICGASTCRSGVRIPADSAVPAIRRSRKTISMGAASDRASYYAETTVKSSSNLLAIGVLHYIRGVSGSYSKTGPIFQNRKKGISGELFCVSVFKKLALKLFYICRTLDATVF